MAHLLTVVGRWGRYIIFINAKQETDDIFTEDKCDIWHRPTNYHQYNGIYSQPSVDDVPFLGSNTKGS